MKKLPHIAILNDYQGVAFHYADWLQFKGTAVINAYHDDMIGEDELIHALLDYDIICIMRERTPLNRVVLSRLPQLKLIISTGTSNASLDTSACEELGIQVVMTGFVDSGTPELTWCLLMALARNIVSENQSLRSGGWQRYVGTDLQGKTLGIVGLGNVGAKVAAYGKAFGMKVIAWSPHLTATAAWQAGAEMVSKYDLLTHSDFVTLHLRLSEQTKGIISSSDLACLKPSAFLINTARAQLVNEQALITLLEAKGIAGAAIDVFDTEPLPAGSPFRNLPNVLASPHIGFVTENTYRLFFQNTVEAIKTFLTNRA